MLEQTANAKLGAHMRDKQVWKKYPSYALFIENELCKEAIKENIKKHVRERRIQSKTKT